MAFDQTTRNRLNRFVSDSRGVLAREFTRQLQAIYGMNPITGEIAEINSLAGLTPHQQETAQLLRDTFEHYLAANDHAKGKSKEKENRLAALDRIVREQAFTVLNRLAALRMSEARGFLIESLAKGYDSKGFQLFHRLAGTSLGETGDAYTHYLFSIFDEFALDLSVLFDRFATQGRLFPSTPVLLELLALINEDEVAPLWAEDETIGWIYQFWNGRDEIDKMRSASRAPRNSREMAVRNQFFTPRYVVEFLTDNTLGRIWYEMTKGQTKLVDECEYLVKRPNERFLNEGEQAPEPESTERLSQEELLQQTVYIEHRDLKDPRDIKMLDPACGSMHFGLYCFDLFEGIYDEAWDIELTLGADYFVREKHQKPLTQTYSDKTEFLTHVPRLIIENNIHGVDIDPRAAQVAGMSLWQRAHNSWQKAGIKSQQRPQITKSNIVCAEPMPGEKELLHEFTSQLKPTVLGQLVGVIFEKMQLAGEAGTLLKIEKEIEDAIAGAKEVWQKQNHALSQFPDSAKVAKRQNEGGGELEFDVSDIDDSGFWQQAEQKIIDALALYANSTSSQMTEQKRLFASDAAKGFAFIELCKQRFDVLLMNPPFGEPSANSKTYIDKEYPNTKGDVLSNFIERSIEITCSNGLTGAITSRTCLFLSSMSNLRECVLGQNADIVQCADLGDGVLDAMVETAAYVIAKDFGNSDFIRLVNQSDKDLALKEALNNFNVANRYLTKSSTFDQLPGRPYTYWVPSNIISKIACTTLEPTGAEIKVGLQTGDDFRFLRNFWEVPVSSNDWKFFSKTEKAIAWYSPIQMKLKWVDDGYELKGFTDNKGKLRSALRSPDKYFKPGFSYMLRSSRLVPYIVPKGCIPTAGRSQVFPNEGCEVDALAICASNIGSAIARFRGEKFGWPKFQASMVQQLPFTELDSDTKTDIEQNMLAEVANSKNFYSTDETTLDYKGCFDLEIKSEPKTNFKSLLGKDNELKVAKSFGLTGEEYELLQLDLQEAVSLRKDHEEASAEEQLSNSAYKYLSFLVGLAFERWGVNDTNVVETSDIYEELPEQPPAFNMGMASDYIGDKGIADLSGKYSLIDKITEQPAFKKELVEKSLAQLGNTDWNTFLSKPLKYFDLHYRQYSQNRRYAPIYWLLQIPSGHYSVWLYYHKINDQTCLSMVNDFVQPKIEEVTLELNALVQKQNRSPAEEKVVDNLSGNLAELETFRDELLRLSRIWQPNLNDGVQISAAPLWRLFQHKAWQKKLKETWEKLEDGEYDWAHLAFSTWPERVLKKCHVDRSLAIAHEVEADLWHEVEVIKGKKKEPVWEWQPKPLSDSELHSYIKQKIATDERLKLYSSNQSANTNGGV